MLLTAISTTATGIRAASDTIDALSNNIANSNTPGYKAGQVAFEDLLYSSLRSGGEGGRTARSRTTRNSVPVWVSVRSAGCSPRAAWCNRRACSTWRSTVKGSSG